MSSTLRNTISDLASTFAASVLDALRGASLEEILAESRGTAAAGAGRRGPGRPRAAAVAEVVDRKPAAGARRKGGRLSRRSQDDIAALVDRIVELLASNPEGLRAEQIRESLGLEAKELPRPLGDALRAKRIAKQGQKRATTYFVRGGGAKASAGGRGAAKAGGRKGKPGPKPGPKAGKRGGRGRRGAKAQGGDANSAGESAG